MTDRAELLARMLASGVYLITDRRLAAGRSEETVVREAIGGDIGVVQLRMKGESSRTAYEVGLRLVALCRAAGVPLLVNDDIGLALAIDSDGVHVGQDDLPARVVRRLIGRDRILGVSAATPGLARAAIDDSADYVGVGAMFATTTKEQTLDTGLLGLKRVRAAVDVPIVAIGGIDAENTGKVITAGADIVAVVRAIVAAPNPRAATKALVRAVAVARAGC